MSKNTPPMTTSAAIVNCEPDADAAVDFLRTFEPEGPWVLTAINPDRKGIETRTFGPDTENALNDWLDRFNGKCNIYFMVNPPLRALKKKARRQDIKSVACLHVDIDPRPGEDPAEEKERILKLLQDPPGDVPKPTFTIFSGGGCQGFWRLKEPIPIDGDLALAEDAKRYNLALEQALGGDNCHNIDRIMRLPGTVNIPDARKRKKGRVKATAELVEYHEDRLYDLDRFKPAQGGQEDAGEGFGTTGQPITISGNVERLQGIDDLDQWNVPDRVKVIIVNGEHPDGKEEGDDSRSGWLFDVICNMLRADVPDDVVFSVITDPKFDISKSVLDKGRRARAYAIKQIQSAHKAIAKSRPTQWDRVDKNGNPLPSYNNARAAIQQLGVVCEYDIFHNRHHVGGHVLQEYQGELSDNACAMLRQSILESFGFDPGKDHVRDAATQLCLENSRDPIIDYLDDLQWDSEERLSRWLVDYLGAEDNELVRAIGEIMLIAAVRRAREPGCKFDTIVVLEGAQGTGKSTALAILAAQENFSDQDILAADARQQMETIEGVWIYEICELEGMTRVERNKIKAFASRQEDRARPAYGRFRENSPRRCIFIGTTNETQYLLDQTGNRRFLPVRTTDIDLEALGRDRDQLWAEAAYKEAAGASIVLPEGMWPRAGEEQLQRLVHDPWTDILANFKGDKISGQERIASAWLLEEFLMVPKERMTSYHYKRLANVMRGLGWKGPKLLRLGHDEVRRGFERPTDKDDEF